MYRRRSQISLREAVKLSATSPIIWKAVQWCAHSHGLELTCLVCPEWTCSSCHHPQLQLGSSGWSCWRTSKLLQWLLAMPSLSSSRPDRGHYPEMSSLASDRCCPSGATAPNVVLHVCAAFRSTVEASCCIHRPNVTFCFLFSVTIHTPTFSADQQVPCHAAACSCRPTAKQIFWGCAVLPKAFCSDKSSQSGCYTRLSVTISS